MNNRRWIAAAARSLVFLMQLGFSILLPPVAMLFGAWYLQEKCSWGGWVWPVAIVLGLIMGASSFAEFARYMQKEARTRPLTDWDDAPPPDESAPNKHRQSAQTNRSEK